MSRPATFAAIVASSLLALSPVVAQELAQEFCGNRDVMVDKLAQEFKENPMAVGMVDNNAVLEIFVSQQGSWTIIATDPQNNSCVISAGDGWHSKTLVLGSDA